MVFISLQFFHIFLNKKGGTNIDLWTFDELCHLIKEYKILYEEKTIALNEEEIDNRSSKSLEEKKVN